MFSRTIATAVAAFSAAALSTAALSTAALSLPAQGVDATGRPHDPARSMSFGVVLKSHGVKIEGCRKPSGQGVVTVSYRLDTRGATGKARAKVKAFSHGELGNTNFSYPYPRYQRPGRVRAFNGTVLFSDSSSERLVPVIELKSGAHKVGAKFRVGSLHRC